MKCEPFGEGGLFGFACGPAKKAPKLCRFCKAKLTGAGRLCDYPVERGRTCDAPMCQKCAHPVGNGKDLCGPHMEAWRGEAPAGGDVFAAIRPYLSISWTKEGGPEFACKAEMCRGNILRDRISAERHLRSDHGLGQQIGGRRA